MLKRGYKNGEKIIEVYEGNLDLVLYNENQITFYYYRFSIEDAFGEEISADKTIIDQKDVRNFLRKHGKGDYQGFINELLVKASDNGMTERYDM